jgi:hypothetical protein
METGRSSYSAAASRARARVPASRRLPGPVRRDNPRSRGRAGYARGRMDDSPGKEGGAARSGYSVMWEPERHSAFSNAVPFLYAYGAAEEARADRIKNDSMTSTNSETVIGFAKYASHPLARSSSSSIR